MTEAQSGGDLENTQVRNLTTAGATLLERAAAAPAGWAALTLVSGAGAALKQTVLAFRGACTWLTTTLLRQRRSRSCGVGCGW